MIYSGTVLTSTAGQMYDGSRVWSFRLPPSHSGFTWDAHLLWYCGGQEKENHKDCRRLPSDTALSHSVSQSDSMAARFISHGGSMKTPCAPCLKQEQVFGLLGLNFYLTSRTTVSPSGTRTQWHMWNAKVELKIKIEQLWTTFALIL